MSQKLLFQYSSLMAKLTAIVSRAACGASFYTSVFLSIATTHCRNYHTYCSMVSSMSAGIKEIGDWGSYPSRTMSSILYRYYIWGKVPSLSEMRLSWRVDD